MTWRWRDGLREKKKREGERLTPDDPSVTGPREPRAGDGASWGRFY